MDSLLLAQATYGLGMHEWVIIAIALIGYTVGMIKGFASVKSDIRNLTTSLENDRANVLKVEKNLQDDVKENKGNIGTQLRRLDAISKALTRHGGRITENSDDIKHLRERSHEHANKLHIHDLKLHDLGK